MPGRWVNANTYPTPSDPFGTATQDGRSMAITATVTPAAAPPPGGAAIPHYGISTGSKIRSRSSAARAFELDEIKQIGATMARVDSAGNNSTDDMVINDVIARGLEPFICIGDTYSAPGGGSASFGNLAGAIATKWKGKARFYEIMNEPDLNGWTPAAYAPYLKAAYSAIKAADSAAIVCAPALFTGAGGMQAFMAGLYANGCKGYFNHVTLHLYENAQTRGSWNGWDQAFHSETPGVGKCVRQVMDEHGDTAIPISATEAGANAASVGTAEQAARVRNAYADFRARPNTGFIFVYAMMNDDVLGFGLLDDTGTTSLVHGTGRRPAWNDYRALVTQFPNG